MQSIGYEATHIQTAPDISALYKTDGKQRLSNRKIHRRTGNSFSQPFSIGKFKDTFRYSTAEKEKVNQTTAIRQMEGRKLKAAVIRQRSQCDATAYANKIEELDTRRQTISKDIL